jgi:hypothetical protein
MRSSFLAAFAAATLAAGCVGNLEPTPPGGGSNNDNPGSPDAGTGTGTSNAKPLFDSDVYPVLEAKCKSCHLDSAPVGNVTGFVAGTAANGYSTITGFTALVGNFTSDSAGILGKIAAGHNGIVYTADEQAKIAGWLNKEAELRNGIGPGTGSGSGTGTGSGSNPGNETPSQATTRLLKQWSGCMSQTNFDTANMPNAWGNLTATNNQECENCHVNGAEGFMASRQSTPFFNTISTNKYYMLQYFTVDLTQGTAAAKIIINTVSFDGVSKGQDPHREHPRFNSTDNNGMKALKTFYDTTMARLTAGQCDPPRLLN